MEQDQECEASASLPGSSGARETQRGGCLLTSEAKSAEANFCALRHKFCLSLSSAEAQPLPNSHVFSLVKGLTSAQQIGPLQTQYRRCDLTAP